MAIEDNFVVAIEIGSSKVTGLAGRKHPDGVIQILAYVQEPSSAFIRKGRINNMSKMTQCIQNIKEKLEQKMQLSISSVLVGIGGMGMRTVANTEVRHLESKMEITQDMINEMCDKNRNSANPDYEIIESIPQEYRLGTQLQIDPVGMLSETIEGHYLNIVINSSVPKDIRTCFRNAKLPIHELPINVLVVADAVLSESEKRSGCVFIDMGADTTSVAIFKNNILRHLAVIPLGGSNVNRDIISQCQIDDEEAEELKIKYGTAIIDNSEEQKSPILLRDGRNISFENFNELVQARIEEIILNINHQINLSKYSKEQLIAGLVVTGGTSRMKNIDKMLMRDTNFEKMHFVRKSSFTLRGEMRDFNKDGNWNTVLALIDKFGGVYNCCGGRMGEEPDLFGKDGEENGGDIVGDDKENKELPEGGGENPAPPLPKPTKGFKISQKIKDFANKLGRLVSDNDVE